MQGSNIRQKLHQYVDNGDEKLLKLMYAVAKEYSDDDDFDYEFSEEDLELFKQRRQRRLNGESKSYTRQEVKDIITGKKKMQ